MFVIHALGYGGAGKMIVYLANHMSKKGYKSIIYVQEQIGKHYDLEENVEVIQETQFFTNYYTRHFQQIFQLRKRVKEINPDLVISFQTNQNALAVLATRGRNIPVIVSERGDPYQYNNIIAKLKTFVINRAEGGVFQTHKAQEYYGKGLQERSEVIYNPSTVKKIDRPIWSDRDDEIAFVARFDIKQKRQDLMIKAFEKIHKSHPEMKLVFYGDGQEKEIIQQLVEEIGIQESVIFKGLVKNIPESIKKSKLFVLSSDFEGMPNALIEAMSLGLPCVSTDCSPGGAAELINTGVNGIIVPRGNIGYIAQACIYMLDHPEIADRCGINAQDVVEKLSPNKIYNQWEEYINRIG